MARYRTLDAGLWTHDAIRYAPLQIGWLYAYIITAEADDEGRFVANPIALADRGFSSTHGVSAAEVKASLTYLSEEGLMILYGSEDKPCGFLTGWYEHQYIQSDRRQSSSLPPPPCEINSWEKADEVRQECADERGFDIRKITYQEALRWNQQRGYQSDNERLTQGLQTDNPGITNCKPKGRIGLQTDNPGFTDGYPEKEVEGEKEGEDVPRAPEENTDSDRDDLHSAIAFEFQRLWPTGIPHDVEQAIMHEVDCTDPEIAKMAARKTVSKFQHTKFDRWKVKSWFIGAAQGMTLDLVKDGKSAPAHDKRDAAMLEWQAEIEREDEERRKLEEAEATS